MVTSERDTEVWLDPPPPGYIPLSEVVRRLYVDYKLPRTRSAFMQAIHNGELHSVRYGWGSRPAHFVRFDDVLEYLRYHPAQKEPNLEDDGRIPRRRRRRIPDPIV